MTKLTPKQVIEINDILKEHLRQDADGDWEYNTPLYSDKKIADKFKVSYWHVMNLRRQMYGDMKKGSGGGWSSATRVQTAELTAHITELEMRIARLESFMAQDWGYELQPKEERNA